MSSAELTTAARWTALSVHAEPRSAMAGSARWHGRYVALLAMADGAAVGLAMAVAQLLRPDALVMGAPGVLILAMTAPAWVFSMALNGAYDHRRVGSGAEEYRRILGGAVRFLACLAVAVLVLSLDVPRGLVATALVLTTAFTLATHHVGARFLHRRRAAGECMHRVLVVGNERHVIDLVRRLRSSRAAGLDVVGACVPGRDEGQDLLVDEAAVRVLGSPADVLDPRRLTAFDSVAVADHDACAEGSIRALLRGSGVDLLVPPTVTDVTARRISVVPLRGLPLLHLQDSVTSGPWWLLQQGCERVLAAVLLVAVLPLLLLAAVAVRLTSAGPALFPQQRLGQGGRPFTIWKLRTMRASASADRHLLVDRNEHDGLLFKIRRDPRVTPVGRFLRRLSIDELPQLWNVITGDMALVGPRPPLPEEVERYTGDVCRRLVVKPGLTGLWQVSGRSDLSWQQGIDLDLYYVDNQSVTGDLAILCKTVVAVVRGRGAY